MCEGSLWKIVGHGGDCGKLGSEALLKGTLVTKHICGQIWPLVHNCTWLYSLVRVEGFGSFFPCLEFSSVSPVGNTQYYFLFEVFTTMLKHIRGIYCRLPLTKLEERNMIKMGLFSFLILSPSLSHLTRLSVWYVFELNVHKRSMGNLTFSLSWFSAPGFSANPVGQWLENLNKIREISVSKKHLKKV